MTTDQLRGIALALRDLVEVTGVIGGTLDLGGPLLTYDAADGFHLVPVTGDPVDITEGIDAIELVPADGVESVRDQFVTLAQKRGADV
jgi:hypothetical protein